MVHTFNCHGLFIFTNNSSKKWFWVSARKWFSSGGSLWAGIAGEAVMCREKDHTGKRGVTGTLVAHKQCYFFFLLLQIDLEKRDNKIYTVCPSRSYCLCYWSGHVVLWFIDAAMALKGSWTRATLLPQLYQSRNKQHISFIELGCLRVWSFSGFDVSSLFHLMSKQHLMLNFQKSVFSSVFLSSAF